MPRWLLSPRYGPSNSFKPNPLGPGSTHKHDGFGFRPKLLASCRPLNLGPVDKLVALLAFSFPAYATSQCPSEFGPKDPIVNLLGWLVVALGIVVGGLLLAYLVRRSRGMRRLSRCALIILGFCGMIAVWVGGLALAFVYFLFQC